MGRVLGLDIGDKRVGVALSDETRLIASPLEYFERVGWGPDVKRVKALAEKYAAELIVSGLPLNMDGSEGFQAQKVRALCEQLEKAGLTVRFQDERLSTTEAQKALLEGDMRRADRRITVDKVAAAVILQAYLDANR